MPGDRVIATAQSPDLVTFTIKIEGEVIPLSIAIEAISVYKEVNRIPSARIVILDGDSATQDFQVSSSDLFIPGKKIEIYSGYHSDEALVFKGVVVKQSIKVRTNKFALMIDCKDPVFAMTLRRRFRNFHDQKDSEIIESIFSEYADVSATVATTGSKHHEMVQLGTTDWDFVQMRSEANALFCFVDEGTVNVAAPDFDQTPLVSPMFGGSILEFDAEMDARTQHKNVVATAWESSSQEMGQSEANEPSVGAAGNLSGSDLADAINGGELVISHAGFGQNTELQTWANAVLLRERMAKLRGRVVFQGRADVKPGVIIELFGVGDRFNGKVFVSGVTQEINDGIWYSHVQFGMSTEMFVEQYHVSLPPAAGLTAAANGLMTGVVVQLAGDPLSEDRIRVRLPMLSEGDQGIWARLACLDAGNDRGAFFRPEIGDEVVVGFLGDDPNEPVVLGMLHSSDKPTPKPLEDDNHIKGFVSRSRMELIFDDQKKAVTLKTPAGKTIELDEESGTISLKDENGNSVTMDPSGIVIESGANLTLKASGMLEIKGSLVKIN